MRVVGPGNYESESLEEEMMICCYLECWVMITRCKDLELSVLLNHHQTTTMISLHVVWRTILDGCH